MGSTCTAQGLDVPPISAIRRVERGNFPTPREAASNTFIVKTSPHPALGEAYLILTDLRDSSSLQALDRLARYRKGTILRVDDLAQLASHAELREALKVKLRKLGPKYVAVAPKESSYREEVVLALWEVFATLNDDPQIDVFPGFLVAPSVKAFEGLIDRSIAYRPIPQGSLQAMVVGQVVDNASPEGLRSLQKVRILRNYLGENGLDTSSLVVREYRARRTGVVARPANHEWEVTASGPGRLVGSIPTDAGKAIERSGVVAMFGHGAPGMTCSLEVDVFQRLDLSNKVILCGSCFSAAPRKSDFGVMDRDLDGSVIHQDRTRFLDSALDRGAVVFFGHMRLNSGFPHLFPVLESWMDGQTVGEGYQKLLDALLMTNSFQPQELPVPPGGNRDKAIVNRRNILLYMVIGDPALVPLSRSRKPL